MEERNYYPGEEPISTEDLIYQIGEKEIDLVRKKKAIARLTKEVNILLKSNQELHEKLAKYEE